LRGLDSNQ